ncbi:ras-related protein Rab-22A-like isoform X2 [Asterias rubens]|uniref:ras-related protein Rab-22A-like isoform X2 n=1 Tax=Asterias rubens TaxID=7604 RepID=UPI001455616D|nr:ras-related protein Rab-22A-like isoform X2 [Asterias rubens]
MMSARSTSKRANGFKVCIIGNSTVGKSCIASRLVNDEFSDKTSLTIGAYMLKELVVDGESYYLNIWDTAGQERFRSLAPLYYRDASAIVLVYDITNEESFASLRTTWFPALRSCTNADIVLAVVGNKLDLHDRERLIQTEEARGYADILAALFAETSAKTGENVTQIFTEIVRRVREKKKASLLTEDRPISVLRLEGRTGLTSETRGPVSPSGIRQNVEETASKHKSGCRCHTQ